MNDLKTFWFDANTPTAYNKYLKDRASGVVDEKSIADFISKYEPGLNKIIVDLGIGTGRELDWIDKLKNITKIIGLDYSSEMLSSCKRTAKNCLHDLELIKDDLLDLQKLPKIVRQIKKPVLYLSLINSLGNFTKEERKKVLNDLNAVLKKPDRIILALYKRTQYVKDADRTQNSQYLQTRNQEEQILINELIEYGSATFLWASVIKKYRRLPRLWYDKINNDIIVHVDGKHLLISHRFSKEEIEEEIKSSGMKVSKIIEGKAMWIVIAKK